MEQQTRFYGRRKGKRLKNSRIELMEHLLPRIRVTTPSAGEKLSVSDLFEQPMQQYWLEVGFGGGEHLAGQALCHPKVGFIGAEPFVNGVASLLAHLNGCTAGVVQETANLLAPERADNVRIFPDDVRLLFPFLPDASFDKIFVLYPDPWPKARHEERRFLTMPNLKEICRLLKKGGELRVATDVADYASWALDQIECSDLFVSKKEDIYVPPAEWISTRYEKKGIRAGRKPVYFIYEKK